VAWSQLEELDPSPDSARRLGELSVSEDPAAALGHYLDCLDRDPGALDCREAASGLALRLDRPAQVLELGLPVVEDLSPPAYLNLLLAARNRSPDLRLEEIVALRAPASAEAWGVVALARRDTGRLEGARNAVQRGLEVAETPELYNLLGVIRLERGDRRGARSAWERALALDPDYAPARQNLDQTPESP
jgi:tetratricopeptide (TPR) repeat protein